MRVLFFAKGVGIGGAEKKLLIFAKYLKSMFGCECSFMTWPTSNKYKIEAIGAKHHTYNNPADVLRITDYVKPDIIHTTRSGEKEDVFDIPLEELKHKYKIVESNVFGRKGGIAHYHIPISSEVLDYFNARKPYEPDKAEYLWNSIDYPDLEVGDLRKELGLLPSSFVFGRISRSDNGIYGQVEIDAYKKFIESTNSNNIYYVSLGKPSKLAQQTAGVKNTIILEATADDRRVAQFYNTIDVMLHANNMGESLGTKIQEAMSYGIPIITHRAQGTFNAHITDLLKKDYTFIGSARRDVTSFYNHMKALYESKDTREEISKIFKERSKQWLPDAIIPKLMAIYRKVLDTR